MDPELASHPLNRADGSATFSSNLFTVIAAVNGPVEVQRRDELPEEAAIEVNIRPASGVGGPRERWLESVMAPLLKSILLVHMHPRTLIQVTLQVTKEPSLKIKKGILDVAVIPALANAAFMALVDGALPLEKTMIASLAVVTDRGVVVVHPMEKQLAGCRSVHAMAYTAQGDMLLDQSVGNFDLDQWEKVVEHVKRACMAAVAVTAEDGAMVNGAAEATPWLRRDLEEKVSTASAWREAG